MEYEKERNVLKEFKLKIFDEVEPEDVLDRLRVLEVITEGERETITKLVNIIHKISYDKMEFSRTRNWARRLRIPPRHRHCGIEPLILFGLYLGLLFGLGLPESSLSFLLAKAYEGWREFPSRKFGPGNLGPRNFRSRKIRSRKTQSWKNLVPGSPRAWGG